MLPVLFELYWLPVQYRIKFKILVFTFKAIYGLAPVYIRDLKCYYDQICEFISVFENNYK